MPEEITVAALVILTLTAFGLYGFMHREINQERMRQYAWLGPLAFVMPKVLSGRGKFYLCMLLIVMVLTIGIMFTLFGPLPA